MGKYEGSEEQVRLIQEEAERWDRKYGLNRPKEQTIPRFRPIWANWLDAVMAIGERTGFRIFRDCGSNEDGKVRKIIWGA